MCTPSPFYSAFSCPDVADKGRGNAILPCGRTAPDWRLFYCLDIAFRKLSGRASLSSPFNAVSRIVFLRPLKQMVRVYANRVVTGVTHNLCPGKWACVHFVGKPMGADQFPPPFTDNTVTIKGGRAKPRPAFIRFTFVNLLPKAGFYRSLFRLPNASRAAWGRTINRGFLTVLRNGKNRTACFACQIDHRSMLT